MGNHDRHKNSLLIRTFLLVFTLLVVGALASQARFFVGGVPTMTQPPTTITGVLLSNNQFNAQTGNHGTNVGSLTTQTTGSALSGTYSLSSSASGMTCTDSTNFAISGSSLNIGSSDLTTARTYNVCVVATKASVTSSPFTVQLAVVGNSTGAGGVISGVTISPNSFVANSSSGSVVGAVGVSMSPGTFSGTLAINALSPNAGDFSLSSATLPSNLLLNGTQPAGTYNISIIPTQVEATNSGSSYPQTITRVATTCTTSPCVTVNNFAPVAGGTITITYDPGTMQTTSSDFLQLNFVPPQGSCKVFPAAYGQVPAG
jgi:hypothetical protein